MKCIKLNSLMTLSLLAIVVGCAKERPYDTIYKEEKLHPKSSFVVSETVTDKNGNKKKVPVQYMYVPSSLGTPMEVADAAPFVQGNEKVVTLKWEERGLSVYEVERDARFKSNDLNSTPVLTIPGDYLAYRCHQDAYGQCTNKEEENTELEWYQKNQFKPDFEKLKVKELNSLDASLVDWSGCISATDAKLVNYEVTPGVINIELQKTYTVNKSDAMCTMMGAYYKKAAESSFDARYFYSLVRVDKLATKNYQAVEYPVPDQNSFGYFKNEELILQDNYDRARPERKVLLNRWNPQRKNNELVYYLSPEYSKPENKVVLDATYEAINVMNKEMSAGNIPFHLKLIEQPDASKAVNPGDIRYNSLVLIEDPLANGLLGYGPTVKNPYTGEILQGHVNMYLGVLKSITRSVYEQASDLTEEEKDKEQEHKEEAQAPATPNDITGKFEITKGIFPQGFPNSIIRSYDQLAAETDTPTVNKANPVGMQQNTPTRIELPEELLKANRTHLENQMKQQFYDETIHLASHISLEEVIAKLKVSSRTDFTQVDEATLKQRKKLNFLSENSAFAEDFFPIAGTSKVVYPALRKVTGILTQRGTLKRWENLTKDQKRIVQNIILRNSYKATLIHELGHNLGLRHNFMGSHDKKNFLSKEEAQNLGLDAVPAYSSIMDYSFSEFNQLKAYGKYDIAALRYAYKREVQLTNGKFMSVQGSLHEAVNQLALSQAGNEPAKIVRMKNYEYCTDENTNLGNLCNRFDEGTSLQEIIKHRIKKYKDAYKYRNLRDGRIKYSSHDMPNYIKARGQELGRIRDILEDRENSKKFWSSYLPELLKQYNVDLPPEQLDHALNVSCADVFGPNAWFCNDYIDDAIKAVDLAGEFFLDLIKMPDHICALVKDSNPNQVVEYRKLADIYNQIKGDIDTVPMSCFAEPVKQHISKESLEIVGENGKFLNGFKDTDPNFVYAQDRYTRGIWPDKIYAMRYLFKRTANFGNTDKNFGALIDAPTIMKKANDVFAHLTLGNQMKSPLPFTTENGKTFKIPYVIGDQDKVDPLDDYFSDLAKVLRMSRSGKSDLVKLMLAQIERERTSYGDEYKDQAFITRNLLAVQRENGIVPQDMRSPEKVYFYNSLLQTTFSAAKTSPYAHQMISIMNNFTLLSKLGAEKIKELVNLKNFMFLKVPAEVTLDQAQQLFFNQPKRAMELLIGLAKKGTDADTINFDAVLGETNGPIMKDFFKRGLPALEEIYNIKKNIVIKILSKATQEEKEALQISDGILSAFATGGINKDLIRYYINQLNKLPNFMAHQDAL